MSQTKYCRDCANAFVLPEGKPYKRCRKSEATERDDATLCGEMRKGVCGPDATLWEPRNGQA